MAEVVEETIQYSWDFSLEGDLEDFTVEKQWKLRTGLDEDTLCGALETLIFLSDRPVNLQKLKSLIDEEIPLRLIHQSIEKLQAEYESKHHGIRLLEVAEGFQFRTKATYGKFVQDLFKTTAVSLTPLALEVLAIIAYKQPISKMEIDQARGVDSSHLIRGLIDKRLVRPVGKSETEPGKPSVYGTTLEFLEVFNLNTIEDLPSMNELMELAEKNSVGKISDIKSIVGGDKEKFYFDEMDELEELAKTIKGISDHTVFTKNLKKDTDNSEEALSAFDILEQFIGREQAAKQNKEALHSCDPVGLVQEGINAPEILDGFDIDQGKLLFDDKEKLGDLLDSAFTHLTVDEKALKEQENSEFLGKELNFDMNEDELNALEARLEGLSESITDGSREDIDRESSLGDTEA